MENWQKLSFNYHEIPFLICSSVWWCVLYNFRSCKQSISLTVCQPYNDNVSNGQSWCLSRSGDHSLYLIRCLLFQPPHDKTNKMTMHTTKTQISLGIRPVWSESSLCTQWIAKGPSVSPCGQRRLWSDWSDAQADLSLHWAHMAYCWFCHEVAHCTVNVSRLQRISIASTVMIEIFSQARML